MGAEVFEQVEAVQVGTVVGTNKGHRGKKSAPPTQAPNPSTIAGNTAVIAKALFRLQERSFPLRKNTFSAKFAQPPSHATVANKHCLPSKKHHLL